MRCADVSSCFDEIKAYCGSSSMGYALLINTENYDVYQSILSILQADRTKRMIRVSEDCVGNNLPKMGNILEKVSDTETYILVGVSQLFMLRSSDALKQCLSRLLQLQVRGHLIVLLDHCQQFLIDYVKQDLRCERRIVLVDGASSPLPRIRLANNESECIGQPYKKDFHDLMVALENLSDSSGMGSATLTVVTSLSMTFFAHAVYSVHVCESVYQRLIKNYQDVAAGTKKDFGTDEQWKDLARNLQKHQTFSSIMQDMFGTVTNLSSHFDEAMNAKDPNRFWYLWLGMKILGTPDKPYLAEAVQKSKHADELEQSLFMTLLSHSHIEPNFWDLYHERKALLDEFPENFQLLDRYCSRVGEHEEAAIYYLTDATEKEEYQFMHYLSIYDYSEQELMDVTEFAFPALNGYLQKYVFTKANMKLPESNAGLYKEFTEYFQQYKLQKMTNRIHEEFLLEIEKIAIERPYNHLSNRMGILKKKIDGGSKIFFFDALGVEYLSYIQQQCEKYGMIVDIQVARCELPSITELNKEFIEFYPGRIFKIDKLDELKHHSQKINYQRCKLPIHLFRELEIIDTELRSIQSDLLQDRYNKAVIVSDHGASRLAVIHEHESSSALSLDEKAEHSGRCCQTTNDPKLPFAAFENGYSVLANYDRFKGGRKANVEVHGGASLEEVLVPIIVLSKRPDELYITFTNSLVEIKPKEVAKITVFSNVPLKKPTLHVNGKIYDGVLAGDSHHFDFFMPDMKRSKNYVADVYDGGVKLASDLPFRVQKSVAKMNDNMLI